MAVTITLRSAKGEERAVQAESFRRYGPGARKARAAGFMVGGFLFGALCIIVPILHFITTWALPLLGVLAGLQALHAHASVGPLEGTCPACQQEVQLAGGALEEPPTLRCPACEETLTLIPEEEPAG